MKLTRENCSTMIYINEEANDIARLTESSHPLSLLLEIKHYSSTIERSCDTETLWAE
jgi:hypothetical protein